MGNPYKDTAKYDLEFLGEIEWSGVDFEFDLTAVWRSTVDPARLFWADDAGCSCPSPFENLEESELSSGDRAALQAHLEDRAQDGGPGARMRMVDMMARVVRRPFTEDDDG